MSIVRVLDLQDFVSGDQKEKEEKIYKRNSSAFRRQGYCSLKRSFFYPSNWSIFDLMLK